MIVSRRTSILLHSGAALALALGLWAWDAAGASVFTDAVFSFCF